MSVLSDIFKAMAKYYTKQAVYKAGAAMNKKTEEENIAKERKEKQNNTSYRSDVSSTAGSVNNNINTNVKTNVSTNSTKIVKDNVILPNYSMNDINKYNFPKYRPSLGYQNASTYIPDENKVNILRQIYGDMIKAIYVDNLTNNAYIENDLNKANIGIYAIERNDMFKNDIIINEDNIVVGLASHDFFGNKMYQSKDSGFFTMFGYVNSYLIYDHYIFKDSVNKEQIIELKNKYKFVVPKYDNFFVNSYGKQVFYNSDYSILLCHDFLGFKKNMDITKNIDMTISMNSKYGYSSFKSEYQATKDSYNYTYTFIVPEERAGDISRDILYTIQHCNNSISGILFCSEYIKAYRDNNTSNNDKKNCYIFSANGIEYIQSIYDNEILSVKKVWQECYENRSPYYSILNVYGIDITYNGVDHYKVYNDEDDDRISVYIPYCYIDIATISNKKIIIDDSIEWKNINNPDFNISNGKEPEIVYTYNNHIFIPKYVLYYGMVVNSKTHLGCTCFAELYEDKIIIRKIQDSKCKKCNIQMRFVGKSGGNAASANNSCKIMIDIN